MKKKIIMLLMVAFMLIPSMVFAQGAQGVQEEVKLTQEQLNYIKETIDISDRELYPVYETRMMAAGESADFAVFHRKYAKLSMSDDAFVKEKCKIQKVGSNYEFELWTKPVSKEMFGKLYWADCTELSFFDKDGNKHMAVAHGEKQAVNSNKNVPTHFTISVPESYLYNEPVNSKRPKLFYDSHFKVWFETNLEDSGALGVIGDAMMNRNARLGLNAIK